jgi:hypothetical protein
MYFKNYTKKISQMSIYYVETRADCGPGLDSIFPTSSITWSVKSKNNAFTFGFRPWSKRRQTKKREHRRLVLNMLK